MVDKTREYDRLNTSTITKVQGLPERGPYQSKREALAATDDLPQWAATVDVYEDESGWWRVFTCTTTTLLPLPSYILQKVKDTLGCEDA